MRIVRYAYPSHRNASASVFGGRSPWNGLESEIDRLFNAALGDFVRPTSRDRFPVDLYEDETNAYVRAELPGFKRDAIAVEVVDGTLTLTATRDGETQAGAGESAPATTKINRSIALPETVRADGVTAAYADGVLTVTLPKKAEAKPRKITVAVN